MKTALTLCLLLVSAPLIACDKVFIQLPSVQKSVEYLAARTPSGAFQVPVINGILPAVYEDKDSHGNVYRRRFDFSIPTPYDPKYGKEIVYAKRSKNTLPPTAPLRDVEPQRFNPPRDEPQRFNPPPEDSMLIVQSTKSLQDEIASIQKEIDSIQRLLRNEQKTSLVKK